MDVAKKYIVKIWLKYGSKCCNLYLSWKGFIIFPDPEFLLNKTLSYFSKVATKINFCQPTSEASVKKAKYFTK